MKEDVWLKETNNVSKQLNDFAYQNIVKEIRNI